MLNQAGIPTQEDLARVIPSTERLLKGPVAIVECFQEIPCDPCHSACKRGAISEMADINECPIVDHERCNGCGQCVPSCPGLAIFIVDISRTDGLATVRIPYEFVPLPVVGMKVTALDREGKSICSATVVQVWSTVAVDKTSVVTLEVPSEYAMAARFFRMDQEQAELEYLCRCEDITAAEVRALIRNGCTTVDEIKRLSRAGMGSCQGKTCRQLIMKEIEAFTGVKPSDQKLPAFRPPVKPIPLGILIGEDITNE